jgi:hypothetical protein
MPLSTSKRQDNQKFAPGSPWSSLRVKPPRATRALLSLGLRLSPDTPASKWILNASEAVTIVLSPQTCYPLVSEDVWPYLGALTISVRSLS